MHRRFHYTQTSKKSFETIESRLLKAVDEAGFKVLHTHDVRQTFQDKGLEFIPYKIVEIYNVKYAKAALDTDRWVGLMMPCPIAIWEENGTTYVSTFKPTMMKEYYADKSFDSFSEELESIVIKIIDKTV